MKLVRLDNTDVIAVSGPVSGSLTLDCFGNNTKKDATVTGYFKGQTINFDSKSDVMFVPYLQNLYGDDFENVLTYFSGTSFKYGDGQRDSFGSLGSAISDEKDFDTGSDKPPFKYNGTYIYDEVKGFVKQAAPQ